MGLVHHCLPRKQDGIVYDRLTSDEPDIVKTIVAAATAAADKEMAAEFETHKNRLKIEVENIRDTKIEKLIAIAVKNHVNRHAPLGVLKVPTDSMYGDLLALAMRDIDYGDIGKAIWSEATKKTVFAMA
jgi:hypothetical protein